MPLYSLQTEGSGVDAQNIGMYPVYQGFTSPAYINGVQVSLQTQKEIFFNMWPNIVQQMTVVAIGKGTAGPYTFTLPIAPYNANPPLPLNTSLNYLLRGHVDITGIISTGVNIDPPLVTSAQIIALAPFIQNVPVANVMPVVYITSIAADGTNITVSDSGQFLSGNLNYGLLMQPGPFPGGAGNANSGNLPLTGGPAPNYSTTQNTINYFNGTVTNLYFPVAIPNGANINAQVYFFQSGLPRGMLFYNNVLTLRSPPDRQYTVELDAYLSPAGFLATNQAIQFGYMSEYIARGAARKILSDTGDVEQFQFYEPLFKEQEMLVWKRSQRQFTSTRTETIYSRGPGNGNGSGFYAGQGGGSL